jgi:hypothetical protein
MLRKISWILLTVVGALTILGGLASAYTAYVAGQDQFGAYKLEEVANGREGLADNLRGRRATAAAYAAAFGVLFLLVVVGPYRRGEVWSWWALLVSLAVLAALVLARIPLLGIRGGVATAAIQLGVGIVALLLDAGRVRGAGTAS